MANKKLLSLLTMLLLFIGQFSVNAQDAQTSLPQSYNRVAISFRDFTIGLPEIHKENFMGGGLDYIHGFRLNETMPFYFETGASISLGFNIDDSDCAYGNVEVPLNFACLIPVSNSSVTFSPFIGIDIKGNIVGTESFDFDALRPWYNSENCNSVQIGWSLGMGISKGKFYFGIACGSDFLKLKKNVNSDNFKVSFGMNI